VIRFTDETLIEVRSGKGGNGCAAFRREKYVPQGGPAGGDGGRGGDVVFCVKRNLRTLSHLRRKQVFKAKNGGDGEGGNRHGADGEDVIIPVPPGTLVKDAQTEELIFDFTGNPAGEQFPLLTGGRGGKGNTHYKSSTNQAPRYAQEGMPGETKLLKVELNIMADIGLVGFPNAGKSSLLTSFTNARPKVAPYPFTTKIPNLGVLHAVFPAKAPGEERDIIIADIPGIIEGASEGLGLGFRFLKHISRTAGLLFIIDAAEETAETAYDALCRELDAFSPELSAKPRLVFCNKTDLEGSRERAERICREIAARHTGESVFAGSILTGDGIHQVKAAIRALVARMGEAQTAGLAANGAEAGKEKNTFDASFLATRSVSDEEPVQYPGAGA
jgi:GTP-binding protein